MIVKNEGTLLGRCLESVCDLVDEIIIVDTGSEDNTIEVAKSYGAKVYDFKWTDHFAEARNYSLSLSSCNWHFVLDADEYLLKGNRDSFNNLIETPNKIGIIRRIDKFSKDGVINHSQAFLSRIIPKGTKYTGRIHEQLNTNYPKINTAIEVYHDGYFLNEKSSRNLRLLKHYINEEKYNDPYYLFQMAKELRLTKKYNEAELYYKKCYNHMSDMDSLRPYVVVDHLYNSISSKNFTEGLNVITIEREFLNKYPDFHFVCGLFYMELVFSNVTKYIQYFPLIEREFLKCLEIGDTNQIDSVIGTGSFLAAYNLGVFYETIGNIGKAKEHYRVAVKYNYEPAIKRVSTLIEM
ncbi:glycosyltransferase family 2 protein [Rossellomorea vietnamensis]|uniref:glycosyltransferase family 2 protein n=1 Tax=Rossellomorea vietnamensis TaxID=218284 RepID=UPI003D2C2B44